MIVFLFVCVCASVSFAIELALSKAHLERNQIESENYISYPRSKQARGKENFYRSAAGLRPWYLRPGLSCNTSLN